MAHRPPEQRLSDDRLFWTMFTAMQSKLHDQRMKQATIVQAIRNLERERECADQRRRRLMLGAALLVARERQIWMYPCGNMWYEGTLPQLPDSKFRENFRVNRCTFNYILSVCEGMKRQDTVMRKAISLDKRVAIALYRLATSAEDRTVANLFGVSRSSVNLIFREFCDVVVQCLEARLIRFPRTREMKEHLRQFAAITGFPQCVGALDGCHIEVCPPKEHATDYYNYKGWYSSILFAVVDHRYRFMYVNVGSPGKNHDAAVFESSRLPKVLSSELFQLEAKNVEGVSVCPVLLGDQAFPLQYHLMKPFSRAGPVGSPSRVFNYRLSSARRVVENAFGRLKARFRIMHKGLEVDIDNVNRIIRACCVLHNICEELQDQCDITWMEDVVRQDTSRPQPVCRSRREEPLGVAVRDALAKHFSVS